MGVARDILKENQAFVQDSVERLVHGSFWPTDIRKEELNDCVIYINDKKFSSQLWRLSPLGGEFLASENNSINIQEGDEINISMIVGGQRCEFQGLAICSQYDSKHGTIFGVRWIPAKVENKSNNVDSRQSKRWICSEAFLPTAVVTNPHKFHDIILFKVMDISAKGFQLRTSLRNKFLIPGMSFSGTFSFPLIGKSEIKFRIKNTKLDSINGKEILRLGVELVDPNKSVLSMIAQYAIQFSDVESIEDLEREGLTVKGLSRKYEIGYCKTDLDFNEVLKLRKSFYLSSDEAASRFADIYDTRSRIFVCKQFGNCVGSVRLQITDHTEKLEFQSFCELPADFPKNFEVIELSRLVYDASYNEKLIVINLFRRSLYVAVESERNWIVASVLEKDFEKFKMLGFKKTSISYSLNVSPSQKLEHHMFIYDVKSSISKNKSFSARNAYIIENSMDLAIMKGSYSIAIFTRLKTKFLSRIYKILLSVINRR